MEIRKLAQGQPDISIHLGAADQEVQDEGYFLLVNATLILSEVLRVNMVVECTTAFPPSLLGTQLHFKSMEKGTLTTNFRIQQLPQV